MFYINIFSYNKFYKSINILYRGSIRLFVTVYNTVCFNLKVQKKLYFFYDTVKNTKLKDFANFYVVMFYYIVLKTICNTIFAIGSKQFKDK